ncbi:hypothetical protein WN55_05798 [Dufourea novaeangliae]|uniref:Uncharacterized protein n=1 Tax=Dufourea novaeangliae TaxID=178035 RepID=A0A154P2C6_DUFNO|nr:hypothetical protein WN55_05798 [Dufourea novaeangliae]
MSQARNFHLPGSRPTPGKWEMPGRSGKSSGEIYAKIIQFVAYSDLSLGPLDPWITWLRSLDQGVLRLGVPGSEGVRPWVRVLRSLSWGLRDSLRDFEGPRGLHRSEVTYIRHFDITCLKLKKNSIVYINFHMFNLTCNTFHAAQVSLKEEWREPWKQEDRKEYIRGKVVDSSNGGKLGASADLADHLSSNDISFREDCNTRSPAPIVIIATENRRNTGMAGGNWKCFA